MPALFFADATTADQSSVRGDCGFPALPFGVAIPCPTIIANGAPLMIIPNGTPGIPAPGPGLCGAITRTAKVKVNGGKGFVEIEGKVPCLARNLPFAAGGDVAVGATATPLERSLTFPVTHNRIVIGSGGNYIPPVEE